MFRAFALPDRKRNDEAKATIAGSMHKRSQNQKKITTEKKQAGSSSISNKQAAHRKKKGICIGANRLRSVGKHTGIGWSVRERDSLHFI